MTGFRIGGTVVSQSVGGGGGGGGGYSSTALPSTGSCNFSIFPEKIVIYLI